MLRRRAPSLLVPSLFGPQVEIYTRPLWSQLAMEWYGRPTLDDHATSRTHALWNRSTVHDSVFFELVSTLSSRQLRRLLPRFALFASPLLIYFQSSLHIPGFIHHPRTTLPSAPPSPDLLFRPRAPPSRNLPFRPRAPRRRTYVHSFTKLSLPPEASRSFGAAPAPFSDMRAAGFAAGAHDTALTPMACAS